MLHVAAGQLINQFVQIANFAYGGFFDAFHADAVDHAFDQSTRRVQLRCLRQKGLEVRLFFQVGFQVCLIVPGYPADDFIDFGIVAALSTLA